PRQPAGPLLRRRRRRLPHLRRDRREGPEAGEVHRGCRRHDRRAHVHADARWTLRGGRVRVPEAGMTGGHTFTPTPDGRYGVAESEYQYAPLRILDLNPPVAAGTDPQRASM